ncbi:hypothetical protein DFJ58DRAFT_891481 [Suillus subalutaceus]|uniref:uncharacterized protein n=1 Tax=Suillus subalutaceus TaxID=48586 RepID=UPI001B869BAA|nr:uncharacterized protein DFJ58DRAFT_891481 [Suillus subalutaceus]KAG1814860.1 hypothetical protein DFJ58DRAFT_891481 [Suillus subalutaceus]
MFDSGSYLSRGSHHLVQRSVSSATRGSLSTIYQTDHLPIKFLPMPVDYTCVCKRHNGGRPHSVSRAAWYKHLQAAETKEDRAAIRAGNLSLDLHAQIQAHAHDLGKSSSSSGPSRNAGVGNTTKATKGRCKREKRAQGARGKVKREKCAKCGKAKVRKGENARRTGMVVRAAHKCRETIIWARSRIGSALSMNWLDDGWMLLDDARWSVLKRARGNAKRESVRKCCAYETRVSTPESTHQVACQKDPSDSEVAQGSWKRIREGHQDVLLSPGEGHRSRVDEEDLTIRDDNFEEQGEGYDNSDGQVMGKIATLIGRAMGKITTSMGRAMEDFMFRDLETKISVHKERTTYRTRLTANLTFRENNQS